MKTMRKARLCKTLGVIFVIGIIAFGLSKTQGYGYIQVVRSVVGGVPQYSLIQRMSFFLFSVLIQYYHADSIVYYIRNSDYLCVRYKSREQVYKVLYRQIIFLCLDFSILLMIGCLIGCLLCSSSIETIHINDLLMLFIQSFLLCWILALILGILLAKLAATVSFVCMTAMTVILMFTSGIISPFTILPIIAHGKQLIAQIITDVIALLFTTTVSKSLLTKEIY